MYKRINIWTTMNQFILNNIYNNYAPLTTHWFMFTIIYGYMFICNFVFNNKQFFLKDEFGDRTLGTTSKINHWIRFLCFSHCFEFLVKQYPVNR